MIFVKQARTEKQPRRADDNFRLLFDPDMPIMVSPDIDIPCGCVELSACFTEEEIAALIIIVSAWLQALDGYTPLIDRTMLEVIYLKLFG